MKWYRCRRQWRLQWQMSAPVVGSSAGERFATGGRSRVPATAISLELDMMEEAVGETLQVEEAMK